MMDTGYRIEVRWSAEDAVWVADVPEQPFCTAHGPSPHEAVAEVEVAVQAWLEAAHVAGRAVPSPPGAARRA